MKAIMVMYDSLRRDLLSVNGGPVPCPNFERLARHSVQFDRCYAGSLPCMPARREIHTGRYNFLHRSWGPLEPFDDSMPEILKNNGVYTHLSTDHYHYIQDGGAGYCGRYSSYEMHRGQESDGWNADLSLRGKDCTSMMQDVDYLPPKMKEQRQEISRINQADREKMDDASKWPMHQTFDNGIEFMKKNVQEDNWFLQIETFDPHEPFFSPDSEQSKFLSPDEYNSPDWPSYSKVHESSSEIDRMRRKYYALVSFCDEQLGRVLDEMDAQNLWEDTMLIVNTDHGFLLSEHEWWGKGTMPCYEELVHIPFFIWDPRCRKAGERRSAVVQTIDIAPTLLEYFNIAIPEDMQGRVLRGAISTDDVVHPYILFGYHGGPIGIMDGRYKLLRAVQKSSELYEYTLMPAHMKTLFSEKELESAKLHRPFTFTKKDPVLQIPADPSGRFAGQQEVGEDLLFDLTKDPKENQPLDNEEIKQNLLCAMKMLLQENEAPDELYERYGI